MIAASFALVCRVLVAAVFALTALWKLANRQEFESSFERLAPRRWGGLSRFAVFPVAGTEVALSATLLGGIWFRELSLVGPVAACGLIAVFTVALGLGEEGGCGCWATALERGRAVKLVPIFRNVALLGALVVAATLSPNGVHQLDFAAALAPLVTGLVAAILLVEASQLVAVATFQRLPLRDEAEP